MFYKNYNGDLYHGKITSLASSGEIWISYEKNGRNEREKKSISFNRYTGDFFYEPSARNQIIFDALETYRKETVRIMGKMAELTKTLQDPIDMHRFIDSM
jgi:hypothetical protein